MMVKHDTLSFLSRYLPSRKPADPFYWIDGLQTYCLCEEKHMRGRIGGVLFSRRAAPQVSWELEGLTTVFGMGTGVALLLQSPVLPRINAGNSKQGCECLSRRGERRRPIVPEDCSSSIVGARRLNDRVRDGNGCDPSAIATKETLLILLRSHK